MVRIDEQVGLIYEADPRHTDLLSAALGLEHGSSIKTPGVKSTDSSREAPKAKEGEIAGIVISPERTGLCCS